MRPAVLALPSRRFLLLPGLLLVVVILSLWIARAPVRVPLLGVGAVLLFLAALLNAEAGLMILILSMLFSPEIPLGGAGGSGLEGSRNVVLRSDDLVLLLVGFAWLARMAIYKDLGAVRRTHLNAAIAVFVSCCLVSTLLGIEAGRVSTLVGLCYVAKYIEYFIIFFITVNYVRDDLQFRRLLAAVLATAALICVYGFWQIPSGVRPSAPFEGAHGEPNTLGGYLVLIFCVACAIALSVPERPWRRRCTVLALACLPPLLATLSRSSWLALAAALLVLLGLSAARRRLAAAAIVGAALLFFLQPESVGERVAYTFEGQAHGSVRIGSMHLDPSSSARISSWGDALHAFARHPVAGWGVTGYGFLDAQYFRILVELGLVGLVAFLCLLGTTMRLFRVASVQASSPLHRGLAMGMTAALAALMVHAVGANTFMLIRIMEPFWLLTGLVVAAHGLPPDSPPPPPADPIDPDEEEP
jgi:O-antigen ligase